MAWSNRTFHANRIRFYATTPASPSSAKKEVLTPLKLALKRYREWLRTDGQGYKITGAGPKYAGKDGLVCTFVTSASSLARHVG